MNQYEDLKIALHDFIEAAASRDPSKVSEALSRVCALQARLGPHAPQMLVHYLERRSYQKALDFLATGAAEAEKPRCGSS
jgi:hypothetical protein